MFGVYFESLVVFVYLFLGVGHDAEDIAFVSVVEGEQRGVGEQLALKEQADSAVPELEVERSNYDFVVKERDFVLSVIFLDADGGRDHFYLLRWPLFAAAGPDSHYFTVEENIPG